MAADWKTIEQRERTQRRARGQSRRGAFNASLGATAATVAEIQRPGSLRRARQVGGYVAGRSRPVRLSGGYGGSGEFAHVTWRDRDEPVGAGLRRRASYLRDVAHKSPRTAIAGGGVALAGYGAARYAQGRSREAYQQHAINVRRRSNQARVSKGVLIPLPVRKPPLKVKALESAMNGVRLARHFDAKGRPDLSRRAVDVVDSAGRRAFGKSQRYSGGAVTVGKREVTPIPKGPLKKAPTIARTGGAQPRAALLKPAALIGVRIGKRARDYDPEDARQRRLGGAIAVTGGTGAALAGRGGLSVVRSVRSQGDPNLVGGLKAKATQVGTSARVRGVLNAVADRKATVIHHGAAGRLAGGAALVGVSAGLARRSHTRRYM